MGNFTFISLVLLFVVILFLVTKKYINDKHLNRITNIISIVAGLAAILVFVIPTATTEDIQKAENEITLVPLNTSVELQNITNEQAIAIAHQYVGAITLEAIPFRNFGSQIQYIAVIAKDSQAGVSFDLARVYILEGVGDIFKVNKTELFAFESDFSLAMISSNQNIQNFGIIDINNDGVNEVFSVSGDFGSMAYSIKIQILQLPSYEISWITYGTLHGETPEIYETYSANEETKTWLYQKVTETSSQLSLNEENDTDIWVKNNGKGFYSGKVILNEEVGLPSIMGCIVDDGNFTWIAHPKGAVYGYDKTKNVNFIIYVTPNPGGDWDSGLVSGKNYLWIGVWRDNGILTYNKSNQTLEIMNSPELFALATEEAQYLQDYFLSERTGFFKIENTSLIFHPAFGEPLMLTLPQNIIFEDEFSKAVICDN